MWKKNLFPNERLYTKTQFEIEVQLLGATQVLYNHIFFTRVET